jgi:hypothetical protein
MRARLRPVTLHRETPGSPRPLALRNARHKKKLERLFRFSSASLPLLFGFSGEPRREGVCTVRFQNCWSDGAYSRVEYGSFAEDDDGSYVGR